MARLLLKKEWKVRALVRKPDAPAARELARLGAELVTGSLEKGPDLERAVEGVSRVFALSTPNEGPEAEARQVEALCAALASRRIEHLVYSSGANVNRPTGLPRHQAKAGLEQRIQALGVPWTIVAPTSFMENMLAPPGLAALRQGRLPVMISPDRKLAQIAVADIARFAVLALEAPERLAGKRVDITSEEISGEESAAVLSRVLGRPISCVRVPPEQVRAMLGEEYAKLFDWFEREGYRVDGAALRREYPEVGWHTFEQWAREQPWDALLKVPA